MNSFIQDSLYFYLYNPSSPTKNRLKLLKNLILIHSCSCHYSLLLQTNIPSLSGDLWKKFTTIFCKGTKYKSYFISSYLLNAKIYKRDQCKEKVSNNSQFYHSSFDNRKLFKYTHINHSLTRTRRRIFIPFSFFLFVSAIPAKKISSFSWGFSW